MNSFRFSQGALMQISRLVQATFLVRNLAWLCLSGSLANFAVGQTFSIDNNVLVPATGTTNVLDFDLNAGILGNDSDSSNISGTLNASVDLVFNGSSYDVTGYSIAGGSFDATDVSFSLIFGVSAVTSNMGGDVMTISPPSPVVGGMFDAADQLITINRGSIDAAGNSFDFAAMPISAPGQGTGSIALTPQSTTPFVEVYDVMVSIPTNFTQDFVIPDVPLFGDVDATISGSGMLVSAGTVTIDVAGDYVRDGVLTCEDIDILGMAIRDGNAGAEFDLNQDGAVDSADYQFWVTDLVGTVIGDANFDGSADTSDFNVWNENKFTNGTGWCQGDFNGDGSTDASDFNIWNENKFTSAPASVPEPGSFALLILGTGFLFRLRQRTK